MNFGKRAKAWLRASQYFTVFKFAHLLPRHRQRLAYLAVTKVISIASAAVTPLLTRYLIDRVVTSGNWWLFGRTVATIFLLIFSSLVLGIVVSSTSTKLEELIGFDLRRSLQKKWEGLPMNYFNRVGLGEHIFRMTTDVDNVMKVLVTLVPDLTTIVVEFWVFVLIAAKLNLRLTICYVLSVPCLFLIEIFHSHAVRPIQQEIQELSSEINNSIQEYAAGIATTKLFVEEKRQSKKFVRQLARRIHEIMCRWRKNTIYQTLEWFVTSGWSWSVILYGFALVMRGELTLGTLVALSMYLTSLMRPVENFNSMIQSVVIGSVSAGHLSRVLSWPEEHDSNTSSFKERSRAIGAPASLIVDDLHFGYEKGIESLKGINAAFEPGSITGVTGPSGTGKSTLVALITRLYQPWQGQILLDGVDTRELSLSHLRSEISVVLQETFLFNGTIRENIAFGTPRATIAEILQAAQLADAKGFIGDLKEKYESEVGQRGLSLSQGQRQKIGLARAFLKGSRLLIIDEGLNSLDTSSRQKVLNSIIRIAQEKTIVLVSHDPTTLLHCNKVVVLLDGRVVSCGSPSSLYEKGDFLNYLELRSRYEREASISIGTAIGTNVTD